MDSLNKSVNNLVIFDDLMSECIKSESVLNLFIVRSHTKIMEYFLSLKLYFQKENMPEILVWMQTLLLFFFNPRDQMQFNILARQMYPNNSRFLKESFSDATSKPHGYPF